MSEHTVLVWNCPYKVEVEQRSKTVFIAVGDFDGTRIERKDQTPGSALIRWKEAATDCRF